MKNDISERGGVLTHARTHSRTHALTHERYNQTPVRMWRYRFVVYISISVFSFPNSPVYFFLHYSFPLHSFYRKLADGTRVAKFVCDLKTLAQRVVTFLPQRIFKTFFSLQHTLTHTHTHTHTHSHTHTYKHFAFPQSPTYRKCNLHLNILIFFSKFLNLERPLEHP